MQPLAAWLLLVPGLAWGASSAFQARCEDTISKSVSVTTSARNDYRVDNTQSWRALTRMKGVDPAGTDHVLGITRTESRMGLKLAGPVLTDPQSGYECVAPRIEVSLFYAPIIIYIGSEFSPGTCAYREILAHEMRHLKTYLAHLPKVETLVRTALSARFTSQPLYAPAGQVKAMLRQEIDNDWMPYMKNEMAKVEVLQAAIDSPQEYARLSKVCKGEVQSLIGTSKRTK